MATNQFMEKPNEATIGPESNVKLGLVIGIAAGLAWVGWVTSELNTIKSSLGKIAAVDSLSLRIDSIDKYGSKAVQELQKDVALISRNLEIFISDQKRKVQP